MSVIAGPESVADAGGKVTNVELRGDPSTRAVHEGVANKARRRTAAARRRAIRKAQKNLTAERMIWGDGKSTGRASAANSSAQPWSTTREILAEIVLPLLGLAVVVGIAVFWSQP